MSQIQEFIRELNSCCLTGKQRYPLTMSVAEQIYVKAQVLPEPAQQTVLDLVEKLVQQTAPPTESKAKFGSAKGLIHIAPDFDEPLEDCKDYME